MNWSNAGGVGWGTVLQAVGAGAQAMGAYRASQAAKAAAKYNAAVSRNNAQIAQWQAQSILAKGARDEQAQRLRTAALKGSQRARLAANGVDLTQGSALRILQDTDYLGEMDALTIRDNAAMDAWGARTQANNFLNESSMYGAQADSISPSGAAVSSLLGSSGQVAASWYNYRKTKAA